MPIQYLHRIAANELLASLPGAALERILPSLTLVQLASGATLYEAGARQAHVYFPLTSTVLLSYMGNGRAEEISLVGAEGVIGIPLFLNGSISPCSAVVRDAGSAYRLDAAQLTGEFNRPGPALRLFLAYARGLTAQMQMTANCTSSESFDQALCANCGYANACPGVGQQ